MSKNTFINFDLLYNLCEREGETQHVENELFEFARLLKTNFELKTTLEDLHYDLSFKQALLAEVLKNYTKTTLQIIYLLIENHRLSELYSISNNFSAWVAEQQQCLFGEFITAVAVSETYKNRAAQILAKKYQKKVLLKSKVSPHILGGFMIKIFNGRVIDASLRGQLQNLQKSISEER